MDSTTQGVLAETIGSKGDADASRRFWLAHMRMGFGIFLLESLVLLLYLHLSPTGRTDNCCGPSSWRGRRVH